jgi:hypothetical protein
MLSVLLPMRRKRENAFRKIIPTAKCVSLDELGALVSISLVTCQPLDCPRNALDTERIDVVAEGPPDFGHG